MEGRQRQGDRAGPTGDTSIHPHAPQYFARILQLHLWCVIIATTKTIRMMMIIIMIMIMIMIMIIIIIIIIITIIMIIVIITIIILFEALTNQPSIFHGLIVSVSLLFVTCVLLFVNDKKNVSRNSLSSLILSGNDRIEELFQTLFLIT